MAELKPMTIDEHIKHHLDFEKMWENSAKRAKDDGLSYAFELNTMIATNHRHLAEWLKELKERREADVQPVNRWISVDDRLPEHNGDCLVWYICDTAFGKSESWGIATCSRGEWYTKHLHGDNIVVLYWQPMPEPPKEG